MVKAIEAGRRSFASRELAPLRRTVEFGNYEDLLRRDEAGTAFASSADVSAQTLRARIWAPGCASRDETRPIITLAAPIVLALDDDHSARVPSICATAVEHHARVGADPRARRAALDRGVSPALVEKLDKPVVDAHVAIESFLVETNARERACSVHNEIDPREARGAVSTHRRIVEMLYAANQELKSMTENLAADVMHAMDGLVVADHRTGG